MIRHSCYSCWQLSSTVRKYSRARARIYHARVYVGICSEIMFIRTHIYVCIHFRTHFRVTAHRTAHFTSSVIDVKRVAVYCDEVIPISHLSNQQSGHISIREKPIYTITIYYCLDLLYS